MDWIAGVDELASETQLSEGWTYALLPDVAISAIDAAVSGCSVKTFHGKKFIKAQAADYEIFLAAARTELLKQQNAFLTFTLLEISWKTQFLAFAQRLITGGLQGAGVNDPAAIAITTHLFPGLMTLQRLTANANLPAIDIEIDSDGVSKNLASSNLSVKGKSIPTAMLIGWAYEAYRNQQFPSSPKLGARGIMALADAKSRAIQVADVFGNFALSYIFHLLGHASKSRTVKAGIFARVFSNEITPGPILNATKLSGPTQNDIEIIQPGSGGLTLGIGP